MKGGGGMSGGHGHAWLLVLVWRLMRRRRHARLLMLWRRHMGHPWLRVPLRRGVAILHDASGPHFCHEYVTHIITAPWDGLRRRHTSRLLTGMWLT